jgi:hypothetical protein
VHIPYGLLVILLLPIYLSLFPTSNISGSVWAPSTFRQWKLSRHDGDGKEFSFLSFWACTPRVKKWDVYPATDTPPFNFYFLVRLSTIWLILRYSNCITMSGITYCHSVSHGSAYDSAHYAYVCAQCAYSKHYNALLFFFSALYYYKLVVYTSTTAFMYTVCWVVPPKCAHVVAHVLYFYTLHA